MIVCLGGLYDSLLFCSQFGLAANTNASEKQWIELGDLSQYSCIIKPSLCGATGSISVWIKVEYTDNQYGVLTSLKTSFSEGFAVLRYYNSLR